MFQSSLASRSAEVCTGAASGMGSGAGAGAAGAKLLVYAMGDTGTGTGIGTGAGTGADARGCAGSGGSSVNEGSVAGRGMRCNAPIMMSHPSLCVCVEKRVK